MGSRWPAGQQRDRGDHGGTREQHGIPAASSAPKTTSSRTRVTGTDVTAACRKSWLTTVAEAGDASLDRATGALVSQDFRQAAVTSVPVTLVLLLVVFGALVAAGIQLLLAGTAVISAISLLPLAGHLCPSTP